MIITEQKKNPEILEKLRDYRRVFLVGCGDCAAACRTGGEPELRGMAAFLAENGKTVTGVYLPEVGCNLPEVRRGLRAHREALENAEAVLVLSCGLGNQVLTEVSRKWVVPGCDTIFIGSRWKTELGAGGVENLFEEKCVACGDCVLDLTGGLCPRTLCAKGMLNGPCGGTRPDGSCETGEGRPCGWRLIYERLKELGRLDLLKSVIPPRAAGRKRPQRVRVQL